MGGLFGIVSANDCVSDVFRATDFHCHLGTQYGGLAFLLSDGSLSYNIHSIRDSPFRPKFEQYKSDTRSLMGIGAISDYDNQPRKIISSLGEFAIATVGVVKNSSELIREAYRKGPVHFTDSIRGEVNPTEIVANIINQKGDLVEGIAYAQEVIRGSCSMVILAKNGIYAARDRLGRTSLIIGKKDGSYAVSSETCFFSNLGFKVMQDKDDPDKPVPLGPGEIVRLTPDGVEQIRKPGSEMQICSFLYVYYGNPASAYERIGSKMMSVEKVRNRCGSALAKVDMADTNFDISLVDLVAGIPDSGNGHAIGYSNESHIQLLRPIIKYTETYQRSFMPAKQEKRQEIADMKLLLVPDLVDGMRLVITEDSIVRGTQLRKLADKLYTNGAKAIYVRPACPPLVFPCEYLTFSQSKSERELAAVRAIISLEGMDENAAVPPELVHRYLDDKDRFNAVVEWIRKDLDLTHLRYQELSDLVDAIGLPKERLCTHCWDGSSHF